MTTYRSFLPIRAHPPTDPRRVAALRAYLRRLAPALTPRWAPTGGRDDFGSALLEIAARLGEETTRRLDGTAERDAMAFFDFLGLPPTPPRAATGVLVLALAAEHALPVSAPARTQLAVLPAAGGDDVTFETRHGLRVVPGAIAELVAVDPGTDRIELAPARVTSLTPPGAQVRSYAVVAFADTGSSTVQLSPSVGLAAEDVLRIGPAAHRIAAADENGLVTLHDPLEAPAPAGATVTKIESLQAFTMRNVQHHALYVGHKDLFHLEQPAEIELRLAPPNLARNLTRLDIAYSMFGTREEDAEPAWQPLDLLGATGGAIRLAKSWTGAVDEVEVSGHKSRWLRAELRDPVIGRASPTSSASGVRIGVASMDAGPAGTSVPPAPVGGGPGSALAEGSRTVVRAAHNGTPLATTRRFYPFGPEPLRFDVFALAVPEALSKKGAEVALQVTMVDSSLASFEIAVGTTATSAPRGYGVGHNGDLEILSFEASQGLRWRVLEPVAGDGRRLLLSSAAAVGIGLVGPDVDLVVVRDQDGGLWSAKVQPSGPQGAPSVENGTWQSLPALALASADDQAATTPNGRSPGPVLAPAPTGAVGVTAVLLGVAERALHALTFDDSGGAHPAGWQPVQVSSASSPALTGAWQLTPVQGVDWPHRPAGNATEWVAIDPEGAVWLGTTGVIDATHQLTVAWRRLAGTGTGGAYPASPDVRPVATRFTSAKGPVDLWIGYARPGSGPGSDRLLHGLVRTGDNDPEHVPVGDHADARVGSRTALHAHPAVLGADRRPVTVGLGPGSAEAVVWLGAGEITTTPLPGGAPTGRPVVLQTATGGLPELVLGGTDERLFRAAIARPRAIEFALHDVLELDTVESAHRVEIAADPDDPATSTIVELPSRKRIQRNHLRVYQVDEPALSPGQALRFLRLTQPNGPTYTAAFEDPGNRAELRLDPADTITSAGTTRLLIGDASYRVTAVSAARVATLEHPVLGVDAGPGYRPVTLLGAETVVEDADIGTLAELFASTVGASALRFGLGSSPTLQDLRYQEPTSGKVWARLDQAWITEPPDRRGWAVVPGSYDAPTWTVTSLERGYQNPELSWEYYDGAGWRRLENGFRDGTANMSSTGPVQFVVPDDLSTTDIGGKDDYWIRARLIGGDYGRPRYVVRTVPTADGTGTVQTVTVDTSGMRPPEILAIDAGYTLTGQLSPEVVLVDNDLDVLDQTQAAAVPAARFEVFQGALAIDADSPDRALYVGLTSPIGPGLVVLLADTADQSGSGPLRVDLRTANGWRRVSVDDGTASLRRRGMVTISLDVDAGTVRLFGQERVWLRLRPDRSGDPPSSTDGAGSWAPVVRGLHLNAVEISQARTVENEILGSSLGEPGTTVQLAERPVLPDTVRLRVRERLSDEERAALEADQQRAAGPGRGSSDPVVLSDLERIPGSWVLWRRVDSLAGQDGDARVYVLDPSSGNVTFGDDRTGKIPPAGRDGIRAFTYQQGGGETGNLPAWSAAKLTSAVEGVETAVLPVDSAGGADPPPADSVFADAPQQLRHAGRALSPADVEALAVASSADVLRAHCARPAGAGQSIRVTIAVRDASRCPVPTLAQRDAIAAFLREVGWGGLAEGSIEVVGPTLLRVAVTVRLVAQRARLADVERTTKTTLTDLFDPVTGGPGGAGWPFGRRPTSSDLLRALQDVDDIDRVESVDISSLGDRPLDQLPADGLVCAEASDITVVVTSSGGAP